MIIVVMTNQQTNQVQMTWEGGDPQMALNSIMTVAQQLHQQIQQQAEANGGQPAPAQRPSGLIIPSTVIPKNINNGAG